MNENSFKEKDFYKQKIIDMVNEINDYWILEQIFRFIKNITKEGD